MTILDDIPDLVNGAFGDVFYDAVMTVDVIPNSPPYDPADPPAPVPVNYSCKAIVESYSDYFRKNGLVDAKDRKVLILATSLGVRPKPGDRITISNITFTLQDVSTDPAEAVWTARGRM